MPIEEINGTPIAFDSTGEGEPVVIVHGSWSERHPWREVVERLSGSFRVVGYDRRGHGESGARPDAGTVHDDVADLAALIETLGMAPANLVANSYGSCIALRLGAARSDLVRKLVAHEPPAYRLLQAHNRTRKIADEVQTKLEEVRQRLERGEHSAGAKYFVEEVALGRGAWSALPPPVRDMFVRHAPTFLGELRDPDAPWLGVDALQRLSVPVLLTEGDHSPPVFAPITDLLVEILPQARRVTIADAGHVPHLSHPTQYASIVTGFLLDR